MITTDVGGAEFIIAYHFGAHSPIAKEVEGTKLRCGAKGGSEQCERVIGHMGCHFSYVPVDKCARWVNESDPKAELALYPKPNRKKSAERMRAHLESIGLKDFSVGVASKGFLIVYTCTKKAAKAVPSEWGQYKVTAAHIGRVRPA